MNNLSLVSIWQLLDNKFFIPAYQRGYRWHEYQVVDLLEDIWEFSQKENKAKGESYCLQPLVVLKREDNVYEVIDGQQRLTTIYIILRYLRNIQQVFFNSTKYFEISYETRKGSEEFLKNLSENANNNNYDDNIDYYYIFQAFQTVQKWFEDPNKNRNKGDFLNTLLKYSPEESSENPSFDKANNVRFIWYEIPDYKASDGTTIFTRLNVGKIPLTNAELIKALFLNKSNFQSENNDQTIIRLKQNEIANEWDLMEATLHDDALWHFINQSSNPIQPRIDLIFKLIMELEGKIDNTPYAIFRFFYDKFKKVKESESTLKNNWQEIKRMFQIIEEWFHDRELFHDIGYLITTGTKLVDILKLFQEKTKTQFKIELKNKIKDKIKFEGELRDLNYFDDKNLIKNILLLHNVQTMKNSKNDTVRFPFDSYKKQSWDLEHINARASDVKLKTVEQLSTWLKENFVKTTDQHSNEEMNKKINKIISDELNNISGESNITEDDINLIIKYVLGEDNDSLGKFKDSISNLCLLDSKTNRGYKNSSFMKKRNEIIKYESQNGVYFLPCTRNIFLKFYSQEPKYLDYWNESDGDDYVENIQETLRDYIKD